ncbi:MAG TPA: sugar transporter permease, partial [Asanoa sp.]|nr:sugar transporter permease [Asanoa sp.]
MARTDVPVRTTTPPKPRLGLGADGTASPLGLIIKIVVLGVVAAIAVWAAFPLIATGNWIGLVILVAVSALIFYVYLSPRVIPAKYLIPGTLFLIVFQVLPVLFTLSTAFTNFGDGHRGSKDEAIAAVEGSSVQQVPGSTVYTLTLATDGDPATGDIVFLLTDPATKAAFVGTADGLEPLDNAQQSADGKVTSAGGYEVLDIGEVSARSADIVEFSVPTDRGAIKN